MSKNKTTTTNQSATATTAPDAASTAQGNQLWNLGLNAVNTPAPQYGGQLTAGLSPDQLAAFSLIQGAGGAGQPQLAAGTDAATAAAGYSAPTINPTLATLATSAGSPGVSAQQVGAVPGVSVPGVNAGAGAVTAQNVDAKNFTDFDLSKYLNPFTDQVVNTSLSDIERARQEAQATIGARQATSGAFGDSRSGVEASLTNRDYASQAASTAAQLRQAGFAQAANLIASDANRQLSAGQGNQAANLQAGIATANNATTAGVTNANLGFQASNANASNSLAAMLANANNALSAATTNATLAQNNNQFNAGAANTLSQFNAGLDTGAQTANAGNSLAANAQRLNAAGVLGNLGMQSQSQVLNQANALGAAGAVEQGTTQAGLTAQYQDWLRQQGWTDQQIQQLTSIYSTLPKGSTTTTTSTSTEKQPGSLIPDLLGGVLTVGGSLLGGPVGGALGKVGASVLGDGEKGRG